MISVERGALRLADRLRRVWWRVRRPITTGAVVIVADTDGRVLLVRNSYDAATMRLPGGGARRGETLAGTAARELREETGITVVDGEASLRLLGIYTNVLEHKTDHIAVFVAEPGTWRDGRSESAEISERRFVPARALPADVSPAVARRLGEWLDARPPDRWW